MIYHLLHGLLVISQIGTDFESLDLRFTRFGVEDGMSQSTVFAMAQDRQGFIWLGGEDGLNRFDGRTFKVFRNESSQPQSLSDDWICSLFVDNHGRLWIGTRKGLDLYREDLECFEHYPFPDGNKEGWVIEEGPSSEIYYGTSGGLYHLNPIAGHLVKYPLKGSYLEDIAVRSILCEGGQILLGTWGKGLLSLNPLTGECVLTHNALGSKRIRALFRDLEGVLWFGFSDGLGRYNEEGKRVDYVLEGVEVTAILASKERSLWIGTNNGETFLKPNGKIEFTRLVSDPAKENGIGHRTTWTILEDKTGLLWFGHGIGGGVSKLGRRLFQHMPTEGPLGLSDRQVWSIYKQPEGDLWIGTTSGLDRFKEGGGVQRYLNIPGDPSSLSGNVIWTLMPGKDGQLWVGTYGSGLNRLDINSGKSKRFFHDPNHLGSLSDNKVFSLAVDEEGSLWVGTNEGGLNRLLPGEDDFERIPVKEDGSGTSQDQIWALKSDKHGNIWIGNNGGGLNQWSAKEKRFRYWHHSATDPESLGGQRVWSFAVDHLDRLWIGLKGGGLNLKLPQKDKFRRFTKHNSGLQDNTVYAIQEDEDGFLWLSTNQGLTKFNSETGEALTFHPFHGLQSKEFNLGASFSDEKGRLYFGGPEGVNIFNPQELKVARGPDTPIISSVRIPGKRPRGVPKGDETVYLKRSEESFILEFVYLDHSRPKDYQYAYCLDGVDVDWQYMEGNRNMARYTSISPGDYHFRVKSTNALGQWTGTSKLDLVVQPAFYDLLIFKFLVVISPIMVAYIWLRRRVSSRRRIARWLRDSREKERLSLEENLHDGALKQLRVLTQEIEEKYLGIGGGSELKGIGQSLLEIEHGLRGVCRELLPPTLRDFGLELSVLDYISNLKEDVVKTEIHFHYEGNPVPTEFSLDLFRVFQKGIHNALEHGGPSNIYVRISVKSDFVTLEVIDDGSGFQWRGDYYSLAAKKHYGLLSARERVAAMKGVLAINSLPGKGTTFKATVPIPGQTISRKIEFWIRSIKILKRGKE